MLLTGIWSDSRLKELSIESKNVRIRVWTRKIWSFKFGGLKVCRAMSRHRHDIATTSIPPAAAISQHCHDINPTCSCDVASSPRHQPNLQLRCRDIATTSTQLVATMSQLRHNIATTSAQPQKQPKSWQFRKKDHNLSYKGPILVIQKPNIKNTCSYNFYEEH